MTKRLPYKFLIAGFFYAIILGYFWIGMSWFSPILVTNLPINLSVDELCTFFKGNDISAYCTVGRDVVLKGYTTFTQSMPEFRLWPLAPFLNFSLATFLIGTTKSIFPFFAIYSYLLWLSVFIVVGYFAAKRLGAIGYLFPVLILILPELNRFLLVLGLYGGDGYGSAYFILGFALLLFLKKTSLIISIISGVLLAVSAYYRSSNETILLIMFLAFICAIFYACLRERLKNDVSFKRTLSSEWKVYKYLMIAILIALICTTPWRAFTYKVERRVAWTRNFDFEVHSVWYSLEEAAPWFIESGGALACKFSPQVCSRFHKQGLNNITKTEKLTELINTIKQHPFAWTAAKSEIFAIQWLGPYYKERSILLTSYRLFLLLVFFLYPIYIGTRFLFVKTNGDIKRVVLLGSILVMSIVMILLVHIEPRYLYLSKILAILYVLDIIALYKYTKNNKAIL